ncbi:hypothetical protein [Burkholderia pseudomallei]|uniref:hypothetical protein n=1 Tax=Burkholderia pseudomallei TaxID=28450 RepID=UPI000F080260|nr:hypothetical protein [Burkholderia pseudomallei]CAJ3246371.1 Uncharacterised protein [Burkholderia pseudomallei]CAJ8243550.1 Uncharacterised protein [Burkholderia pseudomallei]VBF29600.1 Uncharacterised protein [Burkholderia pseudomallei]
MQTANTIEAAFEEFNARVVKYSCPDDPRAVNDCRLIFFAGAVAYWRALENGADIAALDDELSRFIGKTIERGFE